MHKGGGGVEAGFDALYDGSTHFSLFFFPLDLPVQGLLDLNIMPQQLSTC